MNNSDKEFFNKLLATFKIEADEHLEALTKGFLELEKEKNEENLKTIIETVFRETHSLKGAARAVDIRPVQEVCQALENVMADLKKTPKNYEKQTVDVFLNTVDLVRRILNSTAKVEEIQSTIEKLHSLEKEHPSKAISEKTSEKEKQEPKQPPPKIENKPLHKAPEEAIKAAKENKEEKTKKFKKEEASIEPSTPLSADKTIRISLNKLNNIFHEGEELLVVKLIARRELEEWKKLIAFLSSEIKNVEKLFIDLSQLENYAPENSAFSKRLKEILTPLSANNHISKDYLQSAIHHYKSFEKDCRYLETLVDSHLEGMKRTLTQPLNTLFDLVPRVVRDLAKELGKEVQCSIEGGEIEIDRRILEELKDPLIHVIRNAVDHGIEKPELRKKMNKPPLGIISISARECEGSKVEILISDDGNGFKIEKLKEAISQSKLFTEQELDSKTDKEIIQLAFHSGISTSPIVSEISGRGLGLGIISEKVDKLGGHLHCNSEPGKGTTLKLLLPSTLATFRGIHVTASNQDFIFPAHNVLRVVRIKPTDVKTVEHYSTLLLDGTTIPFAHLVDLLHLPGNHQKNQANIFFALLVKAEEKMIAFGVDHLHREQEVLIKPLGKPCVSVKNIMAATIMENGMVIPVLNPVDLVRTAIKEDISKPKFSTATESKEGKKIILIAEDSLTTRLLLQNILEGAGYHILLASDGLEALQTLKTDKVDLLLTDIEMPRMDGFTLLDKVRGMEKTHTLPVIICTGRGSREDRERGIEGGANAYLDKSNFSQDVLLDIAEKLL